MTYSIEIIGNDGKKVGELPTATETQILQYINKGFMVKDRQTGQFITESSLTSTIGVSEGLINIG